MFTWVDCHLCRRVSYQITFISLLLKCLHWNISSRIDSFLLSHLAAPSLDLYFNFFFVFSPWCSFTTWDFVNFCLQPLQTNGFFFNTNGNPKYNLGTFICNKFNKHISIYIKSVVKQKNRVSFRDFHSDLISSIA